MPLKPLEIRKGLDSVKAQELTNERLGSLILGHLILLHLCQRLRWRGHAVLWEYPDIPGAI
jgi:hypothetical protein